jgi:glycosyltransferase involved in cell wall biosynthesis
MEMKVATIPTQQTQRTQKVAAAMMLKNESERIMVTLKTLVGIVKGLIVFDTGSTDGTIEILEKWCMEQNIPLHLKRGDFIDFSKSRNELLDYADTVKGYDYLLLLDCNDELQGGEVFLDECEKLSKIPEKVFMIRQRWLTGTFVNKYLNTRLVKTHHGWRYTRRVHEYLSPPTEERDINRPVVSESVILYQNRNDDDDKTLKRFKRDKELLLADVLKENNPRDMFYLAQTLSCLGEFDESYNWYQKRGEIIEGFWEERFHAYLRSAEIAISKKHDIELAIANYFKAAMIDFRAEPLVALGKIYRDKQDFVLAYTFLSAACELEFPYNNILFVSEKDYSYERWQQFSIVCYYVSRFTEGRIALEIARATGEDSEAHRQNQQFYDEAAKIGKKDIDNFAPEDMPIEIAEIHDGFLNEGREALRDNQPDIAINRFLQSFQLSHRVAPLLLLAEYCRLINAFKMSWCLTNLACRLEIPVDIPKKEKDYSYIRWHLMGIVAFYSNKFKQGKEACIKCIKLGHNVTLDRKNLAHYIEVEKKGAESVKRQVHSFPTSELPKGQQSGKENSVSSVTEEKNLTDESLQKYKESRVTELISLNPKMSKRQANARAQLEWKLTKKH